MTRQEDEVLNNFEIASEDLTNQLDAETIQPSSSDLQTSMSVSEKLGPQLIGPEAIPMKSLCPL